MALPVVSRLGSSPFLASGLLLLSSFSSGIVIHGPSQMAEAEEALRKRRFATELNQRERAAKQAKAERNAAVAELKKQ